MREEEWLSPSLDNPNVPLQQHHEEDECPRRLVPCGQRYGVRGCGLGYMDALLDIVVIWPLATHPNRDGAPFLPGEEPRD